MTDSPYPVRANPDGSQDVKDTSHGGLPFGIDPLYFWSALAGVVVAFLLIGLGLLMRSHALR